MEDAVVLNVVLCDMRHVLTAWVLSKGSAVISISLIFGAELSIRGLEAAL